MGLRIKHLFIVSPFKLDQRRKSQKAYKLYSNMTPYWFSSQQQGQAVFYIWNNLCGSSPSQIEKIMWHWQWLPYIKEILMNFLKLSSAPLRISKSHWTVYKITEGVCCKSKVTARWARWWSRFDFKMPLKHSCFLENKYAYFLFVCPRLSTVIMGH